MKLISEPSVPIKIQKMKQRVRWQHPSILQRGIDQTAMILDDGKEASPDFSFMVIGDSGTKSHYGCPPGPDFSQKDKKRGRRLRKCIYSKHLSSWKP